MTNRQVLRGAGIVRIFAKVRFQPWREIWSFHLKSWGSFCDTFGWTWHEQSFYTNLDMIIFESGISSPLSSMYGIWPLLPNFMVNTFSYLHCTCIVYIWLFQKFKLILSYWLTNLMPASRSQVSSLRANGEIVRTGKELFENYCIVGLLYYYYCLFFCIVDQYFTHWKKVVEHNLEASSS